jgi:hypothetical protein
MHHGGTVGLCCREAFGGIRLILEPTDRGDQLPALLGAAGALDLDAVAGGGGGAVLVGERRHLVVVRRLPQRRRRDAGGPGQPLLGVGLQMRPGDQRRDLLLDGGRFAAAGLFLQLRPAAATAAVRHIDGARLRRRQRVVAP